VKKIQDVLKNVIKELEDKNPEAKKNIVKPDKLKDKIKNNKG